MVLPTRFVLAPVLLVFFLAGCGGGGVDGGGVVDPIASAPPTHLNQAAYRASGLGYFHTDAPYPTTAIANPPADADFSRWAMCHDGSRSHLFCFALGTDDLLYRFGLIPGSRRWELGFGGPATYAVGPIPEAADASSIAMLHDGADYRLYMRGISDRTQLFQFALDESVGEFRYGFRSIAVIGMSNVPEQADLDRWAMLHDGETYRLYLGVEGEPRGMYQFGFDGRTYAFGYDSIPVLTITGMPADSILSSFAMLHDGSRYLFHHLAR